MLEVQIIAFLSYPYVADTKNCFINQLHMLVVHPYAGGTTLPWWYWRCRPVLSFCDKAMKRNDSLMVGY